MPRKDGRPTEKELNVKQYPYRMDRDEYIMLRKLLDDDKLPLQHLLRASVDAYMRGDPGMLKIVRDWKELNSIPKEKKEKYVLSKRDRDDLLRKFEKMDDI